MRPGRAIGAIARHGSTAAPMPMAAAQSAAMLANTPLRLANGFFHMSDGAAGAGGGNATGGAGCSPRNPFKIRSGVNGNSRKRTPVAS